MASTLAWRSSGTSEVENTALLLELKASKICCPPCSWPGGSVIWVSAATPSTVCARRRCGPARGPTSVGASASSAGARPSRPSRRRPSRWRRRAGRVTCTARTASKVTVGGALPGLAACAAAATSRTYVLRSKVARVRPGTTTVKRTSGTTGVWGKGGGGEAAGLGGGGGLQHGRASPGGSRGVRLLLAAKHQHITAVVPAAR